MMAASAAQVTGPTSVTSSLRCQMATRQPLALLVGVHSGINVTHMGAFIVDETMAGVQSALRGDTHIAATCAAWVDFSLVRVNSFQRGNDIVEGHQMLAFKASAKHFTTVDELRQHVLQILACHLFLASRRTDQRGELHRVEPQAQKAAKRSRKIKVLGSNRHTSHDLELPSLYALQKRERFPNSVIAPFARNKRPELIVSATNSVYAHGDGKAIRLKELHILGPNHGRVGRYRKCDPPTLTPCTFSSIGGRFVHDVSIEERFATHKYEVRRSTRWCFAQKTVDRCFRGVQRHISRSCTKRALLGITVSTVEIA